MAASFEKNIFINCPFDNEYFPVLKAILFTVIYLGLDPQISETADSGATRLLKIKDLIKKSKFSIHDISRVELNDHNLPRFNMPLEFGMDLGIKLASSGKLAKKALLVLEKENYRYQEFISDIAGNDIRAHDNDPQIAIQHVRDWLRINLGKEVIWAAIIWSSYTEFDFDFQTALVKYDLDPKDISAVTFADIISNMKKWVNELPAQ